MGPNPYHLLISRHCFFMTVAQFLMKIEMGHSASTCLWWIAILVNASFGSGGDFLCENPTTDFEISNF